MTILVFLEALSVITSPPIQRLIPASEMAPEIT